MNLGGWDLRKAAVTGNTERLLRYVSMYIERATTEVRKLGSENKNVSQAILIINAEEFNLITHGCLQCKYNLNNFRTWNSEQMKSMQACLYKWDYNTK